MALQLTGATAAAVNRAAVEVWKLIEDQALPLAPVASFDGFGRPDGRGWLEFHDGVTNMASSQRIAALAAPADPRWMGGGTYMAFLRLRVDLRVWRALDRGDQELVVGRDKLTGSPLVAVRRDARGRARPVAAPPLPRRPTDAQRADRLDPPQTGDPLLEASHVHRANQNRASPDAPAALRIFRQGYDFLDAIGPDGPELGLNFVSFQSDLQTLQHVMHLPGWLGRRQLRRAGGAAARRPAVAEPDRPDRGRPLRRAAAGQAVPGREAVHALIGRPRSGRRSAWAWGCGCPCLTTRLDPDLHAVGDLPAELDRAPADLDVADDVAAARGHLEARAQRVLLVAALDLPEAGRVGPVRGDHAGGERPAEVQAERVCQRDLVALAGGDVDRGGDLRVAVAQRVAEAGAAHELLLVGDGLAVLDPQDRRARDEVDRGAEVVAALRSGASAAPACDVFQRFSRL